MRNAPRSRTGERPAPDDSYRLDVYTTSIREAVVHAGGLLIDRAMAGWTVTILTEPGDDAELVARILGCQVAERGAIPDPDRPLPYGIAVTSALYDADTRLRKRVAARFGQTVGETDVIGVDPEGEHDPRLHIVSHRLSHAAVVFKARALAAVGLAGSPVGGTEQLMRATAAETVVSDPELPVSAQRG
ncbi:hypothetical protein [Mycolicibacterium thermoresistibile]|uniref:Uncharacterized protein n=2 Tax=Mycolicibacterium thermoresistibile TaxID=1797 RepID=G7CFW5_MYCT3|nr:hypothetical protein [Mycolicibacterium thermoresistibile]EHI13394.1 hypothetical protein KEK_09432 [Mycolicibacterium thermoresistibile ATCC 19527]MCV7189186.1 hypothetical protein [Mycolicibacterium thermoresistibile]GAT14624.1 putative uncharacterized protein [Mycolicibacterium thermoresistibile]SNW19851.1 Uncharacterised protein [Mycolicibacterium thermoresistibile]